MSQPSSLRRSLHQSHPYACLCSGGTRDVGGDDGGADSLSPLPRAGQCVERAAALSGRLLGPPDERDVPPMHPIGAAQDPLFSAGHHLRSPPSPPPTNLGFAPRHPAQQLMNKLYQRSLSQERDQRQMMRDWADGVRQQHERIVPSARQMPLNFLATSSLGTLRQSRSGVSGAAPVGGTIMSAIERAQMPPPPPTMQALSRANKRQLLDKEDVIEQRKMSRVLSRAEHLEQAIAKQRYTVFAAVPLEEPSPNLEPSAPLELAHSAYSDARARIVNPETVYRDERGQIIRWPWEQQSSRGVNGNRSLEVGGEYIGGGSMIQHDVRQTLNVWSLASSGQYDDMINAALDAASAKGDRGRSTTGYRAWCGFCKDKGISPDRPVEPYAPLVVKLGEEWLCCEFVCALIKERGVAVDTARVYFSQTQGVHMRDHGIKLCGGLKLERLPQMLKGLRRLVGDAHRRPQRRAISPKQLREALDEFYDPALPLHANIRAAIACAFAGLMRSAEFCGTTGKHMLLRKDVVHFVPNSEMVVMMHPCKNMHHLEGKTCPMPLGAGGRYIDPVAEYGNLRAVDAVPDTELRSTPLFRDPSTNAPLSYDCINEACKMIGAFLGFPPEECTSHILRISGATAIFAAGGSELMIRTMGRWSSDLHRLYVRCCYEQCRQWSCRMGSVDFTAAAQVVDEVDDY